MCRGGEEDFGSTGQRRAGVFYSNGRGEEEVDGEEEMGGEVVVHINAVSCGCDVEAKNKRVYKDCLVQVRDAHIQVFSRALLICDC